MRLARRWWAGRPAYRRSPTAGLAVLPLVATTVAGAVTVMVGWGIAAWGFVPAQQHRLIGLGSVDSGWGPAPLLLALNSSAIHLGFAAGALLGGLVVDTAGVSSLWMLAVACGGAGLTLHGILTREVRS